MSSSRFRRNGDTPETPSAETSDLRALQERARLAHEKRMRYQLEFEQAEKDVARCQAEAKKFGASTLEELEERYRDMEREDRETLAAFEKALEAEEALLEDVGRRLAQAESMNDDDE